MNKRISIVRVMTAVLSCVMACGLLFAATGCGKTSEEALIKSEVGTFLDVFKDPSLEKLQTYLDDEEVDFESIEEYGIDLDEFLKHSFGHFDYTINSVTIDGDTATVAVSLTNANMEAALEAAGNALTESDQDFTEMLSAEDGMKQFMQYYFEEFYKQMDASEDLVTTDAEIKLNKVDGTWTLDETDIQKVYAAMYGGINL